MMSQVPMRIIIVVFSGWVFLCAGYHAEFLFTISRPYNKLIINHYYSVLYDEETGAHGYKIEKYEN